MSTDQQQVPTESTGSGHRVVVGVDGSDSSIAALRWAGAIAAPFGWQLDAVATWEFPTMGAFSALPADWRPDEDTEKVLAEAVDTAFGADRPIGLRTIVREGHPVRVLLDIAADAQLLVVGSRGHGGFIGLMLGSVSAAVAELSPCPVLVIHGDKLPNPTVRSES
jgi:nucleotide-binding universal stress UspA family protein